MIFVMVAWIGWTGYLTIIHFQNKEQLNRQALMIKVLDAELADVMEHVGFDRIELAKRRGYWGPQLPVN
jgi:hypothetical protein